MAHARMAQVQYDAGPAWRIPLWRSSGVTHFSMAHASMPQFRCGAVPVCRSFAVCGSPSCQYAAVPVWHCSSVSQFRRRWLAVMPVCRSSGVALFQCVAVSPSVARRHASMPQFRCGAVPVCRSFAVGGSPSCQYGACIRHSNNIYKVQVK